MSAPRRSSVVLLASLALLVPNASLLARTAPLHGGQYRGPGDTTPGGGGANGGGGGGPGSNPGPATPPGTAPGRPAGPTPGIAGTQPINGGTTGGVDLIAAAELDAWGIWWGYNKDGYLDLRRHIFSGVPTTGSDNWFLTKEQRKLARETYRPTDEQIRTRIVPALRRALANEASKDVVTSVLIALAKIGEPLAEDGRSEVETLLCAYLADGNQEVRETATVALGILGHPSSIPRLGELLADTAAGRELAGAHEVAERTRAFAAYGLGLIGARAASEEDRRDVVRRLMSALRADDGRTRDVGVAAVLAIGLVPLEPLAAGEGSASLDPAASREGELDFLLRTLDDKGQEDLVRAHCPRSLARLLAGLAGDRAADARSRVCAALLARIAPTAHEPTAVVQSTVLALGAIGTSGAEDAPIRIALEGVVDGGRDQLARCFALIALARMGGTPGATDPEAGEQAIARRLLARLAKGQNLERAWAGLALGVLGHEFAGRSDAPPILSDMSEALHQGLREESDATVLAAYAIGAGLLHDVEAVPTLLAKLDEIHTDVPRGYIAVALGLLDAREAVEPIQAIVAESKYRPELLNQAAIGLGLLGDKALVDVLVGMLREAKGLATQSAIATALGFIGDESSINPLIALLEDHEKTDLARAFAAAALGLVADREDLPWNSELAVDLNYRATTSTLVDPLGSGILDIL